MTTLTTLGREPARIDHDVRPGEPLDFTVPVLDADDAAQDLTGWTLTATVTPGPRDETVLATLTTADDDGVRVTATGATTATWAAWSVPSGHWTLWLTPPASEPDLVAAGWIRITH